MNISQQQSPHLIILHINMYKTKLEGCLVGHIESKIALKRFKEMNHLIFQLQLCKVISSRSDCKTFNL
ncbi:hypothetical protein EB796_009063 [Bugula neritina]|uniref:Uncharacterized protein n=1 Tax=Bugula neritina TaxID=10212 RepID=A0A7J7K3S8_BUGNE|nr:hypothetical protein EB796_009063 [Bugula neritina]